MVLLTFAAFNNSCTAAVGPAAAAAAAAAAANASDMTADQARATSDSEPAGSRYTIAAIALLLWMGTLQVGSNNAVLAFG
jgi:hypothetical protein